MKLTKLNLFNMKKTKPIVGLLLFVGVISLWMFQIISNSNANEASLVKELNSLDSKIIELQSEIYFLEIEDKICSSK